MKVNDSRVEAIVRAVEDLYRWQDEQVRFKRRGLTDPWNCETFHRVAEWEAKVSQVITVASNIERDSPIPSEPAFLATLTDAVRHSDRWYLEDPVRMIRRHVLAHQGPADDPYGDIPGINVIREMVVVLQEDGTREQMLPIAERFGAFLADFIKGLRRWPETLPAILDEYGNRYLPRLPFNGRAGFVAMSELLKAGTRQAG